MENTNGKTPNGRNCGGVEKRVQIRRRNTRVLERHVGENGRKWDERRDIDVRERGNKREFVEKRRGSRRRRSSRRRRRGDRASFRHGSVHVFSHRRGERSVREIERGENKGNVREIWSERVLPGRNRHRVSTGDELGQSSRVHRNRSRESEGGLVPGRRFERSEDDERTRSYMRGNWRDDGVLEPSV